MHYKKKSEFTKLESDYIFPIFYVNFSSDMFHLRKRKVDCGDNLARIPLKTFCKGINRMRRTTFGAATFLNTHIKQPKSTV